YFSSV
ncbi:ribonucleotide reductase, all-alpha domain protein, partial [Chlamydia psittaci 06-1683]